MSIYSGFATRKMEQNYNQFLSKLIGLMQEHLIQALSPQQQKQILISDAKLKKYRYLLSKMEDYQQHKYLPPKFSKICQPLKQVLGIKQQEVIQVQIDDFRATKGQKMHKLGQQVKSAQKYGNNDKFVMGGFKTPKTIFYRPKTHQVEFQNRSQIRHRSTTHKSVGIQQNSQQKHSNHLQRPKSKLSLRTEQPMVCKLKPKFQQSVNNKKSTTSNKQLMQQIYIDGNELRKLNESGQIRYRNKKTQLMRKTFHSKKRMKNSEYYQVNNNQVKQKDKGDLIVKVQFKQASPKFKQTSPKFNIKDQLRKNIKSTQ